ncbi:cytochrome P450 [Gymnopilus junonius]|uniref:Cytochrome P450 n=1 Tax=Gymnopilus junonius TaxID=109634 RepID=A0A9P5NU01_GYMJU|nr:cytochrome P450 [Gymnopilus junonius]
MLPWIVLAGFLLVVVRLFRSRRTSRLPLPPGPKGLPFVGNFWDIPGDFEWITYHKWCKAFNTDILYLNLAGTPLIVLDSYEVVNQLLEKRSAVFSNRCLDFVSVIRVFLDTDSFLSSRPQFPMQSELMGLDFNFAFMDYGPKWQKHRRLMHQHFHAGASRLFLPHTLKSCRNLLTRFLDIPDDVLGNLRQMAGETIMAIAYGIQVQEYNDPYIDIAEKAVHTLLAAGAPGKYLVDTFPILKHVPEWMPGAGFQRKAKEYKTLARTMFALPYSAAKQNFASGDSPACFTSRCLESLACAKDKAFFDEEVIQNNAGAMYVAGSDTTLSAIASCILGLLENPQVIKRAQEELDRVVKPGQLPSFDDEGSLPYITAITKEALRWRDVVPTAASRKLLIDEEYKGYRLPAGSIVVPNAWAILHNEDIYLDPFEFNPDRFMTKDGKLDQAVFDPERACWGFGRRICPGRHMAFSAIWINVASMLAVFDIKKAVDEAGNVIEPSHEYLSGLVCLPKPYKCSITPRSKEAEELIRGYANSESSQD